MGAGGVTPTPLSNHPFPQLIRGGLILVLHASDDGFVYFVLRIAPERDYESGSEFTGAFTMKKLRRQSTKVADPH